MKKTTYLYNIHAEELDGMEYFDALKYKKKAGEKLFRHLFFLHNPTEEDKDRLFYVRKGIEHTTKLLEERYSDV